MNKPTLVIGASSNPQKYSHMAVMLLQDKGHTVIPSHPTEKAIGDLKVVNDLADIKSPLDTISVYVRPEILKGMADKILALKPARVIFNPGTEDTELSQKFLKAGIKVMDACTLVMLKTGQY